MDELQRLPKKTTNETTNKNIRLKMKAFFSEIKIRFLVVLSHKLGSCLNV